MVKVIKRNASILERTQASTIDILLIILLMYLFSLFFENIGFVPTWIRKWLFLTLFVFYQPIFNSFGTTFGNYIIKIRVRKISNSDHRINIIQSFLRYFFKTIFGWISFLTIFMNKKNRAIHDYIGGSVVIKI